MKDFTRYYFPSNPSLYTIFLDALWTIYPDYDLTCEVDAVLNHNEEFFSEYSDPRFEFVGQFLYYLADKHFEINLDQAQEDPEFSEKNLQNPSKLNGSESNKTKVYSFKIGSKYASNISRIIDDLNEELTLSSDPLFSVKLTGILTAKDLSEINDEDKQLTIICKTNLLVYLLDALGNTFRGNIAGDLFNSQIIILTKKGEKLSQNSLFSCRSRNLSFPPLNYQIVQEYCKKYSPNN
jgi:hypothetical protein